MVADQHMQGSIPAVWETTDWPAARITAWSLRLAGGCKGWVEKACVTPTGQGGAPTYLIPHMFEHRACLPYVRNPMPQVMEFTTPRSLTPRHQRIALGEALPNDQLLEIG